MNRKLEKIDHFVRGILVGVFVAGLALAFYSQSAFLPSEGPLASSEKVDVCFTPPQGCLHKIVQKIDKAKSSILIQAYSFTSKDIERALLRAYERRVHIEIIVDRGQKTAKGSIIHSLAKAGIKVYFDSISGIAHNKVMILDQETLITGSFNFTKAANTRNAENLLIIQDKSLASLYRVLWKNPQKC